MLGYFINNLHTPEGKRLLAEPRCGREENDPVAGFF
jgi:hypothetical protein